MYLKEDGLSKEVVVKEVTGANIDSSCNQKV